MPTHPLTKGPKTVEVARYRVVVVIALDDRLEPFAGSRHGSCLRARRCCLICRSFALKHLRTDVRFTVKLPFLFFPLMCVRPRKSNEPLLARGARGWFFGLSSRNQYCSIRAQHYLDRTSRKKWLVICQRFDRGDKVALEIGLFDVTTHARFNDVAHKLSRVMHRQDENCRIRRHLLNLSCSLDAV